MAEDRRSEAELIAHYFAPLATGAAAFGLSDDTAFLSLPDGDDLVMTKDMLVADIHFFASDTPFQIAQKALRVNLSDLAAKGAEPMGYLLGLGLPKDWTETWLADFCKGLAYDQAAFDFALFGGDTVQCPERLTLSVTAMGRVPKGKKILRQNARPGDRLYMTGTLGDSALGLLLRLGKRLPPLSPEHEHYLKGRYLLPQPRLALAPLMRRYVHAAMDISDGLLGDGGKMAKACGARLVFNLEALPLSGAAGALLEQDSTLMQTILSGGDDYELLMAVSADKCAQFEEEARSQGHQVTAIGHVEAGEGVSVPAGEHYTRSGSQSFEHF
ncbi:MAG: thiamine-phosphate kinase [Cohaesibacter sp.]|jgi:thiamine-monophosphate kinase|nr:thiamine-phosphate kinase [Cohaesibacter sp.]